MPNHSMTNMPNHLVSFKQGKLYASSPMDTKKKMAKVIKKVGTQSYLVRTLNERVYRRNIKHLRYTTEVIDEPSPSYEVGEDEFTVSSNAAQPNGEALPDKRSEAQSGLDHSSPTDVVQEETEPSQTATRAGRVSKPSSRYNDYIKH